jgi:hypothetical protein
LASPYQGCQIFLGKTNQNGKNITRMAIKIPNGHMYNVPKLQWKFQMAMKYTQNLHPKASIIYQKLAFLAWK